jgi:hypothetical protein
VNPEKGKDFKRKKISKTNEVRTSKLKHHNEIDLNAMVEDVEKNRDKLKNLEQSPWTMREFCSMFGILLTSSMAGQRMSSLYSIIEIQSTIAFTPSAVVLSYN